MSINTQIQDNLLQPETFGNWVICVYEPLKEFPPIIGYLTIGKDFHSISQKTSNNQRKLIASFPSQNVSYVIDYITIKTDIKNG